METKKNNRMKASEIINRKKHFYKNLTKKEKEDLRKYNEILNRLVYPIKLKIKQILLRHNYV